MDTINKTFVLSDDNNESEYEDKDEMEMEENILIENLKQEINDKQQDQNNEDVEDDENDDDVENDVSFNFLIKNELGIDINLESLYGFKVKVLKFEKKIQL